MAAEGKSFVSTRLDSCLKGPLPDTPLDARSEVTDTVEEKEETGTKKKASKSSPGCGASCFHNLWLCGQAFYIAHFGKVP